MNPVLGLVALGVVAAAVVVVSVRDARIAVLAIATVLLLSAALADPMASVAGLAARMVGAILTAYLLWMAARDQPGHGLAPAPTEGSRIGWPAEVLLAAAGSVVGFAAHGLGASAAGPSLATAAAFGIAALAVAPTLTGRDVFRMGTGLLLLMDAGLLVRVALGGTPGPMEQLLSAGLLVSIAVAVSVLGRAAREDGVGGFSFETETRPRRRVLAPEAHPMTDRAEHVSGDRSSP